MINQHNTVPCHSLWTTLAGVGGKDIVSMTYIIKDLASERVMDLI